MFLYITSDLACIKMIFRDAKAILMFLCVVLACCRLLSPLGPGRQVGFCRNLQHSQQWSAPAAAAFSSNPGPLVAMATVAETPAAVTTEAIVEAALSGPVDVHVVVSKDEPADEKPKPSDEKPLTVVFKAPSTLPLHVLSFLKLHEVVMAPSGLELNAAMLEALAKKDAKTVAEILESKQPEAEGSEGPKPCSTYLDAVSVCLGVKPKDIHCADSTKKDTLCKSTALALTLAYNFPLRNSETLSSRLQGLQVELSKKSHKQVCLETYTQSTVLRNKVHAELLTALAVAEIEWPKEFYQHMTVTIPAMVALAKLLMP